MSLILDAQVQRRVLQLGDDKGVIWGEELALWQSVKGD